MTANDRIRVLVVDDSVVIRRLVTDILDADPQVEVVGIAQNGRIALDKVEQLNPDAVLQSGCTDSAAIRAFVNAHIARGPEQVCQDGTRP